MDVVNNVEAKRFEIALPGGDLAFADYSPMKGKVMFPHTVVPPAHEGKGVGSALAKAALAWARDEGLEVIPACTFFVTYMRRHPETHDILDPGYLTIVRG
jgi:predicted GNAT family acetyltransferase